MTVQLIAYVYPGWHQDEYRPGVNEWDLLDEAFPRFDGHQPLARPANGYYDDTDPAVARSQIDNAQEAGISAFSYFLYWGPNGYVMDKPMAIARGVASDESRRFRVGATWCIRLPHDRFPIAAGDGLEFAESAGGSAERVEDRPLTSLTATELQALIPAWDDDWLDSAEPDAVRPTGARRSLSELQRLIDDLISARADALPLEDVMPILRWRDAAALSVAGISKLLAVVADLRKSMPGHSALSVKDLEDLARALH